MKKTSKKLTLRRVSVARLVQVDGGIVAGETCTCATRCHCYQSYQAWCSNSCNTCAQVGTCWTATNTVVQCTG